MHATGEYSISDLAELFSVSRSTVYLTLNPRLCPWRTILPPAGIDPLSADLLIMDDLGLHRLTAQQSADLYELILNRHRASSFVITSNRAVDEWLSLFDDPILGNSALDRLANASYQIVIEGSSYRERQSPHRALLGLEGGD